VNLRRVFKLTWFAFAAGIALWLDGKERQRQWERRQRKEWRRERVA
jgi:hypothetical protein